MTHLKSFIKQGQQIQRSTHWGKILLYIQICFGIWWLGNVNFVKNEILEM